jgi:hypothetical protein
MLSAMVAALVKIGKASEMLGVAAQTLRAWEASGELIPDRRSAGGTRYYAVDRIRGLTRQPSPLPPPAPEPSMPTSPEPPPLAEPGHEPAGRVRAAIGDVPLSAEAAALFRQFAGDVAEETVEGGEFGAIRLFAEMLPQVAARLGATIAADRDSNFTELSLVDFQHGVQIACALAYEAKRLCSNQTGY